MADKVTRDYFADKPFYPMCRKCGWRMGPCLDSWNGKTCKCGLAVAPQTQCGKCHGQGRVPYNIGTQPCSRCDGSGLVGPVPVVR